MGQIVKRTKRGRPAKVDRDRPPTRSSSDGLRRSLRRRNVKYVFDLDDYFDEDGLFPPADEEQRRREKKLKHLLRIEGGGDTESTPLHDSAAPSSASSDDGGGKPCKKRKIDEDMDEYADDENDEDNYYYNYEDEVDDDDEFRERKPEPGTQDSEIGTHAEVLSGIPLPNNKALELILDKLQKKDIYGVYAEPVDPEELPDYHDVIEHPMDFATVRNKLRHGLYMAFEQFESDVFLICSNAMQYNAPDTIYHKQARSIQELARKKFQNIRSNAKHMEEIKAAEQRTRTESNFKKQIKRSMSQTVQEPVGSDFSSGATLATAVDVQNQNGTNTRQPVESERPGANDRIVEGNSFLNDNNVDKVEESQSGKGSMPRFSRKPSVQDENRRATYSISLSHEDNAESVVSTSEGEVKQLVPVGLYSDHSYARSLARFSASLGSVPWKVASARIEEALPQGFKFGRGWVGEYEPLPTPVLILENCTVREPPYLKKVHHPVESFKSRKIPTFSVPSNETAASVPFFDQRLPFSGPTGFRPPNASITTAQPTKDHISEMKAPFFLASKPINSPNSIAQHQNLRGMAFVTELDKNVPKQAELNVPTSLSHTKMEARSKKVASKNVSLSKHGSFKLPASNGAAFGGMRDARTVGNNVDATKMNASSSPSAKPANNYPHQQAQAPNNQVQLMRTFSENPQSQQKPSIHSTTEAQVLPLASSSGNNGPNNAAIAAARAWMSVGAGGFKPAPENPNPGKNQIYVDSLYNSTREMQCGESKICPAGNGSPVHTFVVPQGGQIPMMGNVMSYQNQRMVFPQLSTGDLSRLQLQSNWRNISPQMVSPQIISRQKQESRPPDLNIGFQSSSGSPGKPSSGVLMDSQQPDLALQL